MTEAAPAPVPQPGQRAKMPLGQALALIGGTRSPYAAAAHFDRTIGTWRPPLLSVDNEILRDAKTVRTRARDLYRNHPHAKQAVREAVKAVVGKKLRYSSRIDHKFLGIDPAEAKRWDKEFSRVWDQYSHGPGAYVDAARKRNFTQLMRLALRTRMVDGETLAAIEWAPERRWKTCIQIVDVDRLDNPHGKPNTAYLRDGVVLDNLSAPVGYYIRAGHPADVGIDAAQRSMTWEFKPRETPWGRPVILHSFQDDRAGQTRGISDFTTVIRTMKMEGEFGEADLAAAILQASYALVIKSKSDRNEIMQALGMEVETQIDPETGQQVIVENQLTSLMLDNLQRMAAYYNETPLQFGPGTIPHLAPDDELQLVTPGNKGTSAPEFSKHAVKRYAAGLGGEPIAISQDYSDVNYSSARMSVASNWRGHDMTRGDLVYDIGMPVVRAFLEEAVFSGAISLPKGVSNADFYDALPALAKGVFLSAGPPMLDPVKERQGQQIGWSLGKDTLEEMCAEEGVDWEEKIDQKALEIAYMRERGVPIPGEPVLPPVAASDAQAG